MVPNSNNLIHFEVLGAGQLIGVGNGDPSSHEPDKAAERSVFNGFCQAIVQARMTAGDCTVKASSPGLESAATTLHCRPAVPPRAVFVPRSEHHVVSGPGLIGQWKAEDAPGLGAVSIIFLRAADRTNGSIVTESGDDDQLYDVKLDGDNVSFNTGWVFLKGKVNGDQMTLNLSFGGANEGQILRAPLHSQESKLGKSFRKYLDVIREVRSLRPRLSNPLRAATRGSGMA